MTRFLVALIALTSVTTSFAEGDAQAGRVKAYTCTGCHGIPGYKNTYPTYHVPRLGGQHAAYIESALQAYRDGSRTHGTMTLQSESLSDGDIADIAAWLSSIERKEFAEAGKAAEPAQVAQCQACHGADGLGTSPENPVLAGQHASYIARALNDYRSGARKNPVMGGMAAALTDKDIETLARWYSQMPGVSEITGQ